jgi:predicted ATP-grasp superfamily ATP-dependent carboligase
MNILITDGESRAALAAVRSLGAAGHRVTAAGVRTPCLAQTSHHCHAVAAYRDPERDEDGFVDDIVKHAQDHGPDVVLPIAELSTRLLATNRHRLPLATRLPIAAAADVDGVCDKLKVTTVAARLGIPVPRTTVVQSPEALVEMPDFPGFPVVVKPRSSRVRTPEGWFSSGVRYATSRKQLLEDLRRRRPAEFPLMLQERIVGPGLGVFLCYARGRVVARFCHRRIREKPPSGGVSVLSESVPMDPRAEASSVALLDHFSWSGPAMVEFKIDNRTGTPVLMEINGRFWGSLQLAIDAGVDFPAIAVEDDPEPRAGYRVGVRSRWLWGDVDSLLIRMRSPLTPGEHLLERLRAVGDFLRRDRSTALDNPRPGDWRPFRHETKLWLKGALLRR